MEHAALRPADSMAIQRMLAVRPVLSAVVPARDVLKVSGRWLMHAGPPVPDPAQLCLPQRNSAVLAILFEGWADDIVKAKALLAEGEIQLLPAQDHGCAVPLADMLSPRMPLLEVMDAAEPGRRRWSTLNGGDGPVLRVGRLDLSCIGRLRWLQAVLGPALASSLQRSPIPLWPLALRALHLGDDLHGRTAVASALLERQLDRFGLLPEVTRFLHESSAFFLNVWMAACKCILSGAEHVPGSAIVTAIGGNGEEFGLQVAALPGRWFTAKSPVPVVPRASDELAGQALGAIGDSAIVDALGFGAMAHGICSATAERLHQVLPPLELQHLDRVLDVAYPDSAGLGLRFGLRVDHVGAVNATPVVSLGVLDRLGERGRLDGGFLTAPPEPFAEAWQELEFEHAKTTS